MVYGQDRALAEWAAPRLGVSHFVPPFVAIGVARHARIAAAAIFNNYQYPNIHITFVRDDPHWASRGAISAILRYPFVQLGCKRITAITEPTNQPARAFLCRLGFKQEGTHPDLFASGDGLSYGLMARDAARWLAVEEDARIETAKTA